MPVDGLPARSTSSRPNHSVAQRRSLSVKVASEKSNYPPAPLAADETAGQALLSSESESTDPEMGRYAPPLMHEKSKKPKNSLVDVLKRKSVLFTILGLIGIVWLVSGGSNLTSSRFSGGAAGEDSNTDFEGLGSQNNLERPNLPEGAESSKGECIPVPGMPDHQYALMIDAGSTGSRIHIYEFAFCQSSSGNKENPLPTLRNELFYQLQPGLSSYAGKPKDAAESLRPLMDHAIEAIPEAERSCTPVAVKATAGLRLLGKKQSDDILKEVRQWLENQWPFQVAAKDGVVIMDGKDEGVYAWITINYLLGLIGPAAKDGQSAAVMDLGGASTQIVFEPRFPSEDVSISPGDHVYELSLPSGAHTLYQHSHLGYGLMQARRSVHNLIAFTYVWQAAPKGITLEWEDLTETTEIPTPCLVKGGRKVVTLDPPGRAAITVTLVGTGAGFDACRRVVDVVMAKDALCEVEPCAFGGVYQPKLMETFGSGPIYALSYFYDRIVPLGVGGDSAAFSVADLRQLTQDVCMGPDAPKSSLGIGWSRFKGNAEAMAELEDRPEYCLDLTFMYSLLSLGYELAEDRQLRTGKKIDGVELGWALGAAIALLENASLKCTV